MTGLQYSAQALVLLARLPEAGRVKTRLSPPLAPAQCLAVHRWLLHERLATLPDVAAACYWFWTGSAGGEGRAWLARAERRGWRGLRQVEGDLGVRMGAALRWALLHHERVVLVGSDCPGLTPARIGEALALLRRWPLVLNPAMDGGYVLIGMTRRALGARALFSDMPWGGDQVLRETLLRARRAGIPVALLPPLSDIDRAEDLPGSGVPEALWRR